MLMHDHFDYWSRIAPGREFGVDMHRRLSYAEAAVEVAQLSSALHAAGMGTGDRVAIIARNRLEFALASFAASQRGGGGVPGPPPFGRLSGLSHKLTRLTARHGSR